MSILQKKEKSSHNPLSNQYNFFQFAIKPKSRDTHRKEIQNRFDQMLKVDFSRTTADLKINVSIYTRKQIRQKREGISAC